jgi:hypothetical protein
MLHNSRPTTGFLQSNIDNNWCHEPQDTHTRQVPSLCFATTPHSACYSLLSCCGLLRIVDTALRAGKLATTVTSSHFNRILLTRHHKDNRGLVCSAQESYRPNKTASIELRGLDRWHQSSWAASRVCCMRCRIDGMVCVGVCPALEGPKW